MGCLGYLSSRVPQEIPPVRALSFTGRTGMGKFAFWRQASDRNNVPDVDDFVAAESLTFPQSSTGFNKVRATA